jgi:Nucleotidyl transferase AbiEii toxin, Type IV TA system
MLSKSNFVPRLDVLPPSQRRLWDELGTIPPEFVLFGGTALALHLGHRQSVDFDFFGNRAFQPRELIAALSFLATAAITQQAPNTLSVTVDRGGPVRLSFFGVPAIPRLQPPLIAPDTLVRVASLLDIAGTKASVVQQRAEAKDYVDIDAILTDGHIDLPTALGAAKAIYGAQFNPLITLKALSFFDDGDLSSLPQKIKDRLVKAARGVDLERIPAIEADRSRHPDNPGTGP